MERDWSSRLADLSSLARLALALALVASPFWLFPHAGEATYVYEAEEVEYTEGVTGYLRADGGIDGLACYDYDDFDRQCLFAAHVAQNGPTVVNQTFLLAPEYRFDTEYVTVEDSGTGRPFYRWRINRTETDGGDVYRMTYSLEAVGPGEILRNVSVPPSELSGKARRALDGATVRTHGDSLAGAGKVVRTNGTYYHLAERGYHRPDRSGLDGRVWQAVAFVVGLAALRYRWRHAA